ncbi:NAD(H) kinase 1 [Eutrema salsugineum]|uniref:NAD(H) kinase 1 n=1 Tax=Eutrema salsugineum TaxID=72664 RepID=UPI000CED7C5E|nr:NAD(H) kinase 1 [Eutrema salsugineum]
MQATDDHLIEFSEALRTVAKALRGSAEGKALAQAEAAEWKQIYELERSKNLELLHKVPLNGVHAEESHSQGMDHSAKSLQLHVQENGKLGRHSMERICSHEVLQDGESNSCNGANNKLKERHRLSFHGDARVRLMINTRKKLSRLREGTSLQQTAVDKARHDYETEENMLVLNEVTIDRGISSYLTNLECYCDNSFVTCVQGNEHR